MAINIVVLMGRLTAQPEIKHTTSGKSVLSFTLAVDKRKKDAGADFVNCVAWEQTAEFISKYFTKGDMLALSGRIESRSYETKSGEKRTAVEVIVNETSFCGSKKEKSIDVAPELSDADAPPEDEDLPF